MPTIIVSCAYAGRVVYCAGLVTIQKVCLLGELKLCVVFVLQWISWIFSESLHKPVRATTHHSNVCISICALKHPRSTSCAFRHLNSAPLRAMLYSSLLVADR